jgi:hypothetical protein
MRAIWALAAVAAGVGGAIAAPAGLASAETPQETINRLQNEGYTVNIDRVGTAPIDECVVTNVRNPKTITQLIPLDDDDRTILVPIIISQSVSVSLDCTRR